MANGVKTYLIPIGLVVDAESDEDAANVQEAVAELIRYHSRVGELSIPTAKMMGQVHRVKRVNVQPVGGAILAVDDENVRVTEL